MAPEHNDEAPWINSSKDEFYEYYAEQSESEEAVSRAKRTKDAIVKFREHHGLETGNLRILDVGCNAGAFSFAWAKDSHQVVGVDINERLIELAQKRASELDFEIDFRVGSATDLPVDDESFDVCISPELLEHVADWQSCINEYARVLKPGGTLYLTTTNVLCPKQQEFNLPLYSWYPGFLKRRYERLSVTTKPQLANYATYPAVNWFSFYQLRDVLRAKGMESSDRFDLLAIKQAGGAKKVIVDMVRSLAPLRFLGHVGTPSTMVMAKKT